MKRYLRIAFSVVCGLLAVGCIVLWMSSLSWRHRVEWSFGRVYPGWAAAAISAEGLIAIGVLPEQIGVPLFAVDRMEAEEVNRIDRGVLGFLILRGTSGAWFWQTPLWFPILITAAAAAAPWIPWSRQFSLRTMMIVMTFVAIGLGVIAVSI